MQPTIPATGLTTVNAPPGTRVKPVLLYYYPRNHLKYIAHPPFLNPPHRDQAPPTATRPAGAEQVAPYTFPTHPLLFSSPFHASFLHRAYTQPVSFLPRFCIFCAAGPRKPRSGARNAPRPGPNLYKSTSPAIAGFGNGIGGPLSRNRTGHSGRWQGRRESNPRAARRPPQTSRSAIIRPKRSDKITRNSVMTAI